MKKECKITWKNAHKWREMWYNEVSTLKIEY